VLLTLFGWIPGIIYAVYVLTKWEWIFFVWSLVPCRSSSYVNIIEFVYSLVCLCICYCFKQSAHYSKQFVCFLHFFFQ
jgi:hypothetical protein